MTEPRPEDGTITETETKRDTTEVDRPGQGDDATVTETETTEKSVDVDHDPDDRPDLADPPREA